MVEDRLISAALTRMQELGLPLSLIDFGEFREDFFRRGWVMLVRDKGNLTEVDLFHPEQGRPSSSGQRRR